MADNEIINGYEAVSSVQVGPKRMILAIHPDANEKNRYMKCIGTESELFRQYESVMMSKDYCEIVKLFADDIKAEAVILESKRRAIGMENPDCLTKADLIPVSYTDRIVGKVVAIDEKVLYDGCRDISHQLFLVNGGFGAEASSRGSACMSTNLYTGKGDRIERQEIIGIVPEDKLPDFAKKTIAKIKNRQERDDR